MAYLDVLVPAITDPDDLLERLRRRRLTDGGSTVDPGPLDEATLNLVRRAVGQCDRDLVLALPQGRHDIAIVLGVLLQLSRLGARMSNRFQDDWFDGPLMVVGLNVNLTDRLRRLKIGAENLSEALRVQRVRAEGSVIDLKGTVSPARAWSDGLLYLNTSLGWPQLKQVRPGLVIIDRTSFRNSETLDSALTWAASHQARRIMVVSAVGEPLPPSLQNTARWLHWGWTPGLRRQISRELGHPPDCGPLSTNALLSGIDSRVLIAEYRAPEFTRLRRRCLRGVAAARRTNLPFPPKLAAAVQLINLIGGTWGKLSTADQCAVQEPRGMSTATLRKNLQTIHHNDLSNDWAGFRETHWPDLRRDAIDLFELIEDYNPRFEVLRGVLEYIATQRDSATVTVRTQQRSGARALLIDLMSADPDLAAVINETAEPGRLAVLPYSGRIRWTSTPSLELHLGVPPPWHRACLMGGEATEQVLVADPEEKIWAARVLRELDSEWKDILDRSAGDLGFDPPSGHHIRAAGTIYGPVNVDARGEADDDSPIPTLDLASIFADFACAVDEVQPQDSQLLHSSTPGGARSVLARPIRLEPGDSEYWLPTDSTAEVLVGDRYSSTPVSSLAPGMTLLIPRGETRDALYSRLLQAAHQDADVKAVTLMLQRFRNATRDLHNECGTWDAVMRALRSRGSTIKAGNTCRDWADGRIIAPDDITDIRRVAWLTKRHDLTNDHTWQRMGAMAAELRRLHRGLGRVLNDAIAEVSANRAGANLRKLSDMCGGIDPAEVLEEFELRQVRSVGAATSVPAAQLRRITPRPHQAG
ncbi:hypothetical protein HNP40_001417 [Mycobacteroides chelonae]|nr:hypothetical protein [Mycobacteroides chelonae]